MKAAFAILILMTAMSAAAASPSVDGYRSTTDDYTPYRETPMADWRMANQAIGPMHGHMGHMTGVPASSVGGKQADTSPAESGLMGTGSHHHHMGGQP